MLEVVAAVAQLGLPGVVVSAAAGVADTWHAAVVSFVVDSAEVSDSLLAVYCWFEICLHCCAGVVYTMVFVDDLH